MTGPMPYLLPWLGLALLAGCDTPLGDNALRLAALQVVQPVIETGLPADQANLSAHCIVDGAAPAELQALARDLGVRAGPSTTALIADLLSRPQVQTCLAEANLPQPRV